MTENPVNIIGACAALGCGRTYVSAIKRKLGIRGRYFFLSQVRRYIRDHPDFRLRDVYPHQRQRAEVGQ